MKSLLHKIQKSDNATKKIWLYFLTSVSMLTIVGLWIGYMNTSVPEVGTLDTQTEAIVEAPHEIQPGGPSILAVFASGFDMVYKTTGSRVSRGIALIKDALFKTGNSITVTKKQPKLFLKNLDELPPNPLP